MDRTARLVIAVLVLAGASSTITVQPARATDVEATEADEPSHEATSGSGRAALADFNGDGLGDLAVGVGSENFGDLFNAGGVHVIYGSPTGLSATGAQFLTQDTAEVEGTVEKNDGFGGALAAADFNGDAFADLAIGIPGERVGARRTGAVSVIYGSAIGLSPTVVPDQLWHQNSPSVEGVARKGEGFGVRLVAANFGGGPHADLAVGTPGDGRRGVPMGSVNVIYGSGEGLSATVTPDQIWTQESPEVEGVGEEGDSFGRSLAAANFGGSSQADLAVGVPSDDLSGLGAGAVNVIYGSARGLSATATPDQIWTQDSPDVEGVALVFDFFGTTLAAANFGASPQADLAVGTPNDEEDGSIFGGVNVIYGSPDGLSATATPDQLWNQDSPDVEGVAENFDRFGDSLAAADFGGSPQADLAVGVPRDDVNGTKVGSVNVIYGSPEGLSATATLDQIWSQDSPGVGGIAEDGDSFGDSLAAANFGRGPRSDLAVGVPGDEANDAGTVTVIYGSSAGLSATARPDQTWSQDALGAGEGSERRDNFGEVLAAVR